LKIIDLISTTIFVDMFPDYPKIKAIRKFTEKFGIDIVEKSINIRDYVDIHNEDYKGFAYTITKSIKFKVIRMN
jgi:hypothetical protein